MSGSEKKRRKKADAVPAVKREPTQREIEQRDAHRARNLQRPERPEAKSSKRPDGTRVVEAADGQDEKLFGAALMEALGTRSIPFLNHTLDNIALTIRADRDVPDVTMNGAVAILAAVAPENELEATLAAQMVAANEAAMKCLRRMNGAEYLPQFQAYGNLANKLMRTFGAHVDTLARLRRKGEQTVRHVHVHEGGQAVVADTFNQQVNQGVGDNARSAEQAYGADAIAGFAAVPSPDAAADFVPVARYAERALPPARREEHGRSQGQ